MSAQHVNPHAVLGDLKGFQRRTAVWAFRRMFEDPDPTMRFLVADEVGLGKTHVAKGVVAQVVDHLQRAGDVRHDIVYVCSNGAIARQNVRKLVPKGIKAMDSVERLTMLPLADLDSGAGDASGVNLLAITPGTSLKFGQSTGMFRERCLAYAFLRATWGTELMVPRARWIFWAGVSPDNGDDRLRSWEQHHRDRIGRSLQEFGEVLAEVDAGRSASGRPSIRDLFDTIVDGLAYKREFPDDLWKLRAEMIGEVRRILAIVGIRALKPDLVILDEFQRFKDLLNPDPNNFAAELAHRLFNFVDRDSQRPTRTLLLSATPYRMYTTADDVSGDHYEDFLATCAFLFQDDDKVAGLADGFAALRGALTSAEALGGAEAICQDIGIRLRSVMARTERLSATPDRDGMLTEHDALASIAPDDLRAYLRLGNLAEAVSQHEPTEYWKAGPYLINFMERYKLKEAIDRAAVDGTLAEGERLEPGPGLLTWADIEAYKAVDPQNGRLRWLIDDLERRRAFELLWMPASLPYYDTGSVYETPEAASFTKRLIFSGWAVVPKVVSSLVSYEAERHAYASRHHEYSVDYGRRGGQRLLFRTTERTATEARAGEADTKRRAAAMTTFLLVWPSPTLAEIGDPRRHFAGRSRQVSQILAETTESVRSVLAPLLERAPTDGVIDLRWYWAAPLFLDRRTHPYAIDLLFGSNSASYWEGNDAGEGFLVHLAEAKAMVAYGPSALGRPPDDLAEVLAEVAVGGPGQCSLRAVSGVTGLPVSDDACLLSAAWISSAFRAFFNAPEVTGIVLGRRAESAEGEEGASRYWRDVVRHAIDGNLQAVLDEHAHVLRDWLGHLNLDDADRRAGAADDIAVAIAEALEVRTSSFRVDIPLRRRNGQIALDEHRMRSRFAVAFGTQAVDGGGEARVESVSASFNSPFWPFVLTSTSVGQEGLDFHLWCHAVVHWNLPSNPVDLEQREGRVHRFKGHAVRRNIAATLGPALLEGGIAHGTDVWDKLFTRAAATRGTKDDEMVPYWVFHEGPAKVERHVPVLPFSRDATSLPRLRRTLAAYRLAFGQPRQEELVEFLNAERTDAELMEIISKVRIDLTPPEVELTNHEWDEDGEDDDSPIPGTVPRAFRVHAWKDRTLERAMLTEGFVSIGGDELGDVSQIRHPEAIHSLLTASMPDKRPMAIALYVGYWRRFLWDAQIGDIVVLGTRDRKVAIGEFTGPYTYVANGDERARHRRPVSWKGVGIDRSAMGEDLLKTMNSQHTVQDFKAVKAAARLRVLAETQIDPGR
jgi:hypothetical protein